MHPLSGRAVATVASVIAVITVSLVVLLWWAGTRGLSGAELVTARFDALRTGLSIGLGAGGLFALFLAWRRQKSTEIGLQQKQEDQAAVARAYALQEHTSAATEHDAAARRITDGYTRAVEQLGSDKAPVRLGGLYALERLAQDHVEQRQTIVNVLCAYLRMPYSLPGAPPGDTADEAQVLLHQQRIQEREVRLAAQSLLREHLRPTFDIFSSEDFEIALLDQPRDAFWADIDINLSGAALINFSLGGCRMRTAGFESATFTGKADLTDATFTGSANFKSAVFAGFADFDRTTFASSTSFESATFKRFVMFWSTVFSGRTTFESATFSGNSDFLEASFAGKVDFSSATFTGDVNFGSAKFNADADFRKATFADEINVEGTTFSDPSSPSLAPLLSPPPSPAATIG